MILSDDTLEKLTRLGSGHSTIIDKVRHKDTGSVYVRKLVKIRQGAVYRVLKEFQEKLLRQGSGSATIEHINLVGCFDAYASVNWGRGLNVIMEYCEGGNLEDIWGMMRERGMRTTEGVAGRIAESLLRALAFIHSHGAVHQYIQPGKILLTRAGVVKLNGNFGLDEDCIEVFGGAFQDSSFCYFAPERIKGNEHTYQSESWSLALCILEFIQRRYPYPVESTLDVLMAIMTGEPPKPQDEPGEVPWSEDIKDFFDKSLVCKPATSRLTPEQLLSHPWVTRIVKEEIDMAGWIKNVWQWPDGDGAER